MAAPRRGLNVDRTRRVRHPLSSHINTSHRSALSSLPLVSLGCGQRDRRTPNFERPRCPIRVESVLGGLGRRAPPIVTLTLPTNLGQPSNTAKVVNPIGMRRAITTGPPISRAACHITRGPEPRERGAQSAGTEAVANDHIALGWRLAIVWG